MTKKEKREILIANGWKQHNNSRHWYNSYYDKLIRKMAKTSDDIYFIPGFRKPKYMSLNMAMQFDKKVRPLLAIEIAFDQGE